MPSASSMRSPALSSAATSELVSRLMSPSTATTVISFGMRSTVARNRAASAFAEAPARLRRLSRARPRAACRRRSRTRSGARGRRAGDRSSRAVPRAACARPSPTRSTRPAPAYRRPGSCGSRTGARSSSAPARSRSGDPNPSRASRPWHRRTVSDGSAADTIQKADERPTTSRPMAGITCCLRIEKLLNPNKTPVQNDAKRRHFRGIGTTNCWVLPGAILTA